MKSTIRIYLEELSKLKFASRKSIKPSKLKEMKQVIKVACIEDGKSGEVKIDFLTKHRGRLQVKTNILMAGKEYLVLKGGHTIPRKSIVRVSGA